MFILVFKAKRKNAKRYIMGRYDDLKQAENDAINHIKGGSPYNFYIYSYKWDLIKEVIV